MSAEKRFSEGAKLAVKHVGKPPNTGRAGRSVEGDVSRLTIAGFYGRYAPPFGTLSVKTGH